MIPRIVPPTDDNLHVAAERLRSGDIVAFPTETVYGLGASTFNTDALARVYQHKGRPLDNPLIAHVRDVAQARQLTAHWPPQADQLAAAFWPGALTMVLQRATTVPSAATAGLATIAVRCPAHPVARALLHAFDSPISAPSANRSGHVSPTAAQHVVDDFTDAATQCTRDAVDDDPDVAAQQNMHQLFVLDGGPCETGIESTVIDLTSEPPRVLRPGSITIAMLQEVLGSSHIDATIITTQHASPGTRMRHYAPAIPAQLVDAAALADDAAIAHAMRAAGAKRAAVLSLTVPQNTEVAHVLCWMHMPSDPIAYAARLYSALREAEQAGCDLILIQQPPLDDPAWLAIHDRLNRATS